MMIHWMRLKTSLIHYNNQKEDMPKTYPLLLFHKHEIHCPNQTGKCCKMIPFKAHI